MLANSLSESPDTKGSEMLFIVSCNINKRTKGLLFQFDYNLLHTFSQIATVKELIKTTCFVLTLEIMESQTKGDDVDGDLGEHLNHSHQVNTGELILP